LDSQVDSSESRNTFDTEEIGLVYIYNFDDFTRGLVNLVVALILIFISIFSSDLVACNLVSVRANLRFESAICLVGVNQELSFVLFFNERTALTYSWFFKFWYTKANRLDQYVLID